MGSYIHFCFISHPGKLRRENQDRVFISSIQNKIIDKIQKGTFHLLNNPFIAAVMDGMGGEQHGADAAELARITLENEPIQKDLRMICTEMNTVICAYMQQQHIQSMGTTVAMVRFLSESMEICNVGDSRIYKIVSGKIQQISVDHATIIGGRNGRRVLTQNLGIPKEDFSIEPYFCSMPLDIGSSYLLCSDGLTDTLSEPEIERCISNSGVENAVEDLLNRVLENGGKDNISIILCVVQEE